jgi:two-component system, chemotaxis family, protein-glutamate methylesterase/glutaminase
VSLPATNPRSDRKIRVMIVDDSSVVRGLTRRWLQDDSRIEVVKFCTDGAQAVAEVAAARPDVIVLDVEMPNMDGLTALPHLRKAAPNARIVMASTLTSKGATVTIKALSLGAADYIAKPEATAIGAADAYRRELIEKIVALGERAASGAGRQTSFKLRPPPVGRLKPSVMVVAASTGGPNALQTFLAPIAKRINAPILIVQHMPQTFTTIFADKLSQVLEKPCREAKDGDALSPGTVLLAPGDYHMRIAGNAVARTVRLDKGEQVNFCRPAADPLFDSAAAAFGGRVLAVVLTGMGSDGKNGCGKIVEAGGRVIVQDEMTSVVWGMPGAVALAGHAEAVRPLKDLSQLALTLMNGDAA